MDPMAAIRQTFFQECEEQLAELESGLTQHEWRCRDSETVNAVFRAVHSIKGGAGIFALDDLVRFAHVFETTLDAVRSGRLNATSEVLNVLLQASDTLSDLVRAARGDGAADDAKTQKVVAELTKLISPGAEPERSLRPAAKHQPRRKPEAAASGGNESGSYRSSRVPLYTPTPMRPCRCCVSLRGSARSKSCSMTARCRA